MTSKQVWPFEARSQDLRGRLPVAGAKILQQMQRSGLFWCILWMVHWTDMWGGHFNTSSVMTSCLWTGPLSYRSKLATFGWMLTVSPTWIPIPMASRLSDALQRDDRGHSLYSPLVFNVVADTCKVCLQISALGNRSFFLVLDTPNSYRNC